MTDTSAWLIERHIESVLYYWCAGAPSASDRARHFNSDKTYGNPLFGYCTDVDAAVRFARQEDASLVLGRLGGNGRVAEHKWVSP